MASMNKLMAGKCVLERSEFPLSLLLSAAISRAKRAIAQRVRACVRALMCVMLMRVTGN
jgi:hypothetical protein